MILIVDFGGQTTHLIGRRLRQLGITYDFVNPEEVLKKAKPQGMILSGGPASVYEKNAPTVSSKIFSLGIPILGICYGWQLMAKSLGGTVKNTQKEYGPEYLTGKSFIKSGTVFMSHGDTVTKLPSGFSIIGSTEQVKNAAVFDTKRNLFGVQFHPEAHHTEHGLAFLKHFAQICNEALTPLSLSPKPIIENINNIVGNQKVICAVSGGVDSTVTAFLIEKAIGKRLIPVYIDSGLMRPETDIRVRKIFGKHLKIINAKKLFLGKLKGITDPEIKRKTIGKLYIDLFQKEALKHKEATFLGQGTIYSDVIESKGTKLASHIKSHHNVGGLPKNMKLKLLEPMRNFYKDEVREIGSFAGVPEEIIKEHPFPGPGYAVRIRGEVTKERVEKVKIADQIVVSEMKKAGLYDSVFQCFAVMTGAFSTAVKGDARVFGEVIAIRAYESVDIMTSQWSRLPYDVLATMSSRIVNEVPGISRVVYDITTKPPATMEWE